MKYSLIQVEKEHDGLVDGILLHNFVGTLEEVLKRAEYIEKRNGSGVKVAVIEKNIDVDTPNHLYCNLTPITKAESQPKVPYLSKPVLVTITETYKRTVVIHAEDVYSAGEIAEELCNDGKIEINFDNFCGRDIFCQNPIMKDDQKLALYQQFDENGAVTQK